MSRSSRARTLAAPSSRITAHLAADLPDHRMEVDDGAVSFRTTTGGPALRVRSRTDKRFLGRTETAVFEAVYDNGPQDGAWIALRHTGSLRRSGLGADVIRGGGAAGRLAKRIAEDERFRALAMPLDFTSFTIHGEDTGCRVEVELVGASHVAIALPPMRSYVRLHADQRQALIGSLSRLGELIDDR